MRTELFWDVTQWPKTDWPVKMEPTVVPKRRYGITTLRNVTSHIIADLKPKHP